VLITAEVIYQGMLFTVQLGYAGCVVMGYYRRLGMLTARSAWDGEPHPLNEVYEKVFQRSEFPFAGRAIP
jgi:hypothetical protein